MMERRYCYDVSAGQGGIWFRSPILWKYKVIDHQGIKESSQFSNLNYYIKP